MREDGENGMSVIDEVGTPMEEGIMESLCDVSIRTGRLLADYIRFTGRVLYIGGGDREGPAGYRRKSVSIVAVRPGLCRRESPVFVSATGLSLGRHLPSPPMGRADGSLGGEFECVYTRAGHGAVSSRVDSVVPGAEKV